MSLRLAACTAPILAMGAALVLSGCSKPPAPAAPRINPFSSTSTLPLQAPMFDKIKDSDYEPGFDQAMKEHDGEIAAIANSTEAPTFDNTIAAMERSGRMLDRVSNTFFGVVQANTNPALDKVQSDEAPKLAAHQDAI